MNRTYTVLPIFWGIFSFAIILNSFVIASLAPMYAFSTLERRHDELKIPFCRGERPKSEKTQTLATAVFTSSNHAQYTCRGPQFTCLIEI